MKKRWVWGLLLSIMGFAMPSAGSFENDYRIVGYDIIIYGGGPQAVAAALKAADVTKDRKRILLIVPERQLGSLWTSGAQNLFDWNEYRPSFLPDGFPVGYKGAQGGSAFHFLKEMTLVFPPDRMADHLRKKLAEHRNIGVLYETDIAGVDIEPSGNEHRVTGLTLQHMIKDQQGRYIFDNSRTCRVVAPIYLDASETGRLLRLSGQFQGVIGRGDRNRDQKQMAATLMFKMKGIQPYSAQTGGSPPFQISLSEKGALQIWGGYEINQSGLFRAFADRSEHFRIKPYNAGEDGYRSHGKFQRETEFWMNMLLIYDVDARKAWRDKVANNGWYPEDGGLDPEIAREMAIREIGKPDFLHMIRTLPGFEHAQLVTRNGHPVVGETLYLRESIHSSEGNGHFALDDAGVKGNDRRYYARRIGLGYYLFDTNTYEKREALSAVWPASPWYIPYETLVSPKLSNVLLPGYGANISSFAWTAMRVYPNLIVLGDAAGIAAGLAAQGEFSISRPTKEEIARLQAKLREVQAILEK